MQSQHSNCREFPRDRLWLRLAVLLVLSVRPEVRPMPNIPITLTCADYARVMPLITGDVKPEGIDLTVIHGALGSWSDRAEMLRRALQDPTVHGGEGSVAQHLYRVAKGDHSFVALPAF